MDTKINIQLVLEKHRKWLNREEGGERADLRGSNLSESNLSESDLSWSNLSESDLSESNLSESDLSWSNLSESDLSRSDLSGSDLRWSDLRGSDLRGSDLRGSDLRGSDLSGSDLRGSDLRGSDLSGSNLSESDLDVKEPPLNDHQFISEILFRSSVNTKQRMWAGCVRISTDWCWDTFKEEMPKVAIVWAKKVLCDKWSEFKDKFKEEKRRNESNSKVLNR